jgi:hypothetical protein
LELSICNTASRALFDTCYALGILDDGPELRIGDVEGGHAMFDPEQDFQTGSKEFVASIWQQFKRMF